MNAQSETGGRGQILIGVIMVMLVLLIMVPALVTWVQHESRASVKDQKSGVAFNLAQAAVERGMWKLKSSTSTWGAAVNGTALAGYNFDVAYGELPGGTYRIAFSSGVFNGSAAVTVWGEGRDTDRREVRSIQAIYENVSISGAIIANSNVLLDGNSSVNWGPVMAMGDINLSGTAATQYRPRKLSRQVVVGTGGQPRDINGLTPPNTDNLEWWSDYDVPELPLFDFTNMRASAVASNTLNCGGAWNNTSKQVPCNTACVACNISNMYKDNRNASNYVWYWDNNVIISGSGIKGTTIVRGNLTLSGADYGNNSMAMNIPVNAWMEYQKLDTTSSGQYPGDTGYHSTAATYTLGSSPGLEQSVGDLAFNGFVYVGSNISMLAGSQADIYGAIWVAGGWDSHSNNEIFFNDKLQIPALNVVLLRRSWREVSPSTAAWP